MTVLIRTLLASVVVLGLASPVYADDTSSSQSQQPSASDQQNAAQPADSSSNSNNGASATTTTNSDGSQTATATSAAPAEPVNVNTADYRDIKAGLRVSTARAKAIVAYRTKNGPFKSVDDLSKVRGITKNWLDKNRDKVTVG